MRLAVYVGITMSQFAGLWAPTKDVDPRGNVHMYNKSAETSMRDFLGTRFDPSRVGPGYAQLRGKKFVTMYPTFHQMKLAVHMGHGPSALRDAWLTAGFKLDTPPARVASHPARPRVLHAGRPREAHEMDKIEQSVCLLRRRERHLMACFDHPRSGCRVDLAHDRLELHGVALPHVRREHGAAREGVRQAPSAGLGLAHPRAVDRHLGQLRERAVGSRVLRPHAQHRGFFVREVFTNPFSRADTHEICLEVGLKTTLKTMLD